MPNPIVPLGANYTLLVLDFTSREWRAQAQRSGQTYLECLRDAERNAKYCTLPMRFAIQYDMPSPSRLQVVIEEFTLQPKDRLID